MGRMKRIDKTRRRLLEKEEKDKSNKREINVIKSTSDTRKKKNTPITDIGLNSVNLIVLIFMGFQDRFVIKMIYVRFS